MIINLIITSPADSQFERIGQGGERDDGGAEIWCMSVCTLAGNVGLVLRLWISVPVWITIILNNVQNMAEFGGRRREEDAGQPQETKH